MRFSVLADTSGITLQLFWKEEKKKKTSKQTSFSLLKASHFDPSFT